MPARVAAADSCEQEQEAALRSARDLEQLHAERQVEDIASSASPCTALQTAREVEQAHGATSEPKRARRRGTLRSLDASGTARRDQVAA
jgi:hypothetical protein